MDNLFDICLESVMFDYYCTEGFKDTLIKAGKAVVKGIARAIDFLINVARRTINMFRNIFRKAMGKTAIKIENRYILTDLVTSAKKVKKIKYDMAKECVKNNTINNNTADTVLSSSYDYECGIYDSIDDIQRASNSIKNKDSQIIQNNVNKIIDDYKNDLIDIDTMNKQLPDDFKLSDKFINNVKGTTKSLDEIRKHVDAVEKELNIVEKNGVKSNFRFKKKGSVESSFEPTEYFKKRIENRDYGAVRRTLAHLIFTDRNFSKKTFDGALAYVNREYNDNSIYQEYNGKGLISDIKKQKFTDDDFEEAVAELGGNFCKERIDDVKKLSKIVYGNK